MPGGRTVRCLLLVPCALLAAACGDAAVQGTSSAGSLQNGANGAPYAQLPAGQAQAAPVAPGAAVPAPLAGSAGSSDKSGGTGTTATGLGAPSVPVNLGIAQGRVERSVSARYV